MSAERTTFHESWHRVASLRPVPRTGAQFTRQWFRGSAWHVARDAASNQFFRLSEPAYRFLGLLDGRRTVEQAWRLCFERLGDSAPTQGEALSLLAQMHAANLLHVDAPGDVGALLRRKSSRRVREVASAAAGALFFKLPLVNPDRMLSLLAPAVRPLFSPMGLCAWAVLVTVGLWHALGSWGALASSASGVLSTANLPWLYAAGAASKLLHELAHAFACKVLGSRHGDARGGEVNEMGLMFLVLLPMPYVDASSAWMLRSKRERVLVSAAGMMCDLALASVAAVVWSRTAPGTPPHELAYNVMFLAGVGTVLFNANPLMKYDGYYILSDLIEMPNLARRAFEQISGFVKRRLWGVRDPAYIPPQPRERAWLLSYGVLSAVYRVVVCAGILLFIAGQQLVIGGLLIAMAVVAWVLMPLGRLLAYMLGSPDLERTRARAWAVSAAILAVILLPLGLAPVPQRVRLMGVVEPAQFDIVRAAADGFVVHVRAPGSTVNPGDPLVEMASPALTEQAARLSAELRRLDVLRRVAQRDDPAHAQRIQEQIAAVSAQLLHARSLIESLTVRAPFAGVWTPDDDRRLNGAVLQRGVRLGALSDESALLVRAVAPQNLAAALVREAAVPVQVRARGDAGVLHRASLREILPAGQNELPSEALGYLAGGDVMTESGGGPAFRAVRALFEVRIDLHTAPDRAHALRPGQRVAARIDLHDRPLLAQWWDAARRTVRDRLGTAP